MASEHNDNYLGATRIIHVLAAHDEAMRARVVAFPGALLATASGRARDLMRCDVMRCYAMRCGATRSDAVRWRD
eukprot:1165110-Rhodomonas_salina.1